MMPRRAVSKRHVGVVCGVVVAVLLLLVGPAYALGAARAPERENKDVAPLIYVVERASKQGEPLQPQTRGNCSDLYSREWCNAHGYANNRPVGGKVILNSREMDCLYTLYRSLAEALAAGVVYKSPTGAVLAMADFAFNLWRCS